MKNSFIPWMNISTFRNVKFTFGYTPSNLYYSLFIYYLKKVLIVICNALNPCSVTILILFLTYAIIFIIFYYTNSLVLCQNFKCCIELCYCCTLCNGCTPCFL